MCCDCWDKMLNCPPARPCCRGVDWERDSGEFWILWVCRYLSWRHKCSRTYSFFVVYNCQKFEECLGFSMQTLNVCMPGVSVLTADLEIVGKKCWIRLVMWRWLTDNGSQNNCVKTARNIKRIWWVLHFLWCSPFTIVLETLGCLIIFLVYLIHLTMK